MAQLGRVRKERPKKKFRLSWDVIQWVVVGIVAAFMGFFLIRALVSRPTDTPPIPFVTQQQPDLIALTRTLGEINLDSTTRSMFPAELASRLPTIDSLVAERRFNEAVEGLQRHLRRATPAETAAIRAYLGYCYLQTTAYDLALMHWRKARVIAVQALPGLVPWLDFAIGFLFGSRSLPDSALASYRRIPPGAVVPVGYGRPGVLNNTGVALELLGDSTAAARLYLEARTALGPEHLPRAAEVIAENISRLARFLPEQ